MYTIAVTFTCLPGQREAFIETVNQKGIAKAVRQEQGCLQYDYYFAEGDPNQILLLEAWESKDHQQAHLAQPHMVELRSFKDDYVAQTEIREFVWGEA